MKKRHTTLWTRFIWINKPNKHQLTFKAIFCILKCGLIGFQKTMKHPEIEFGKHFTVYCLRGQNLQIRSLAMKYDENKSFQKIASKYSAIIQCRTKKPQTLDIFKAFTRKRNTGTIERG